MPIVFGSWFIVFIHIVAPSGPPVNMKTTLRSISSLSFTWDPPEKTKQNGVIISYTGCVSRSENGPCFQTFISSKGKWLIGNLNASTKYYVRVFASTKAGHGGYSESIGFFTNASKYSDFYILPFGYFILKINEIFALVKTPCSYCLILYMVIFLITSSFRSRFRHERKLWW